MAMLFAATYPERVSALVLWATFARVAWAPDYQEGIDARGRRAVLRHGRGELGQRPRDAADLDPRRGRRRGHPAPSWPGSSATPRPRRWRAAATPLRPARRRSPRAGRRSRRRRWCSTAAAIRSPASPTAAISPSTSAERGSSSCPATSTSARSARTRCVLDEIEEFLTGTRAGARDRPGAQDDPVHRHRGLDRAGRAAWATDAGARLLDAHDSPCARELERFHGKEVKTIGDGFLADLRRTGRAIRCAQAISDKRRATRHRGPRRAAHRRVRAARRRSRRHRRAHRRPRGRLAGPGEVLVTSTVRDLVTGSGIEFDDRGRHTLKGIPGEWQLLAATP